MPRRYQTLWVAFGVLALPPGLMATYLGLFSPTEDFLAMAASFIPFGVLAWLVAALTFGVAFFRARHSRALGALFACASVALALQISWLAPFLVPNDRPATTEEITVMSLNLYHGEADPGEVMQRAQQADVLVLLEFTPTAQRALQEQGLDDRFPYAAGRSETGVVGAAIYSRYPLSQTAEIPDSEFQQWMATADVPDLGPVRIFAVHPCNPICGDGLWDSEHRQLRALAQPHLNDNLIMAGDFNAVSEHRPLRQLKSDGMTSATDIVGAGWLPTYPTDMTIPPVIAIDHVLLSRSLTATAIESFAVTGTDHRGLITQVAGTSTT